ncbi:endosome/lysosome-associated apoptosis and autophagy regulator family member 2-like isoform X2 [Gigantopelta aegis]|uniref:endosome/lysosome-associated apoptosis and autophagy regulator family member 2-like isoform X2 n=1 Tax=Gigantopelta aegis TaxID=1735272 RepID=UPI001B88C917|nr:endosome/lysosome-associated apoptosis and autophagy regulator family member 2-like isoform X2 [Gigantopelta aegis]
MMSYAFLLPLVNLVLYFTSAFGDNLPTCQPNDFHYEYTECDAHGGRWRVSVPSPNKCIGGAPNPPVRGKQCTFKCKEGEYLDLSGDQECKSCPAGTYSLGGGVRFDDWDHLPKGFIISSEGFENTFGYHFEPSKQINCSRATWQPAGNFIVALPNQCTTKLVYTTKLVEAGQVQFEYQYTDPETLFHFMVQNSQCQSLDDDDSPEWPKVTEEGQWHTMKVNLMTGMNVLRWRVMSGVGQSSRNPVRIRKIIISGVAYTSECTKCRSGTYSSGGTAYCSFCEMNTVSERGAHTCSPCNKDTEYSASGDSVCKPRPTCTDKDYYEYQMPCDKNKQTKKTYKWIMPQICSDKLPGSVSLPADGESKPCPPCNPGMHTVNASHCNFCPPNQFSDGSHPCEECHASTSPQYALEYKWWMVLPPNVSSRCLSMSVQKCSLETGWVLGNDHIRSHFSHEREVFLILAMDIPGFRGKSHIVGGKAEIMGEVAFTFETKCTNRCEFVFLTNAPGRNSITKTWEGTTKQTTFKYNVMSKSPLTLTWAFQPADWEKTDEDFSSNYAKIYSIKVTNTLNSGAASCKACPRGTKDDDCIPCPNGHYIDPNTTTCKPCPPNTVLSGPDTWGVTACKQCGAGLKPIRGVACESDCTIKDASGKEFDFKKLNKLQYIAGNKLFTSSGTQYYHGFNFSLCGSVQATCVNNVSHDTAGRKLDLALLSHQYFDYSKVVKGMICRSTMVPQTDQEHGIVSTQPVSLGDHLIKIETNVSMADRYKEEGFPDEHTEEDVHFHYSSDSITSACPDGRRTIVSLKCDVKQDGMGRIDLPPKCSDGTCDGCTFHFMWRSQHACPVCREQDYEVIVGECVRGEQIIHYYPPKHCILQDNHKPKTMKKKCTTLPFIIQVSIPVVIGIGLLLIITVIYCWKRNKKLEYKYSKLIENSGGKDGELPGAESCGLDEGDEEESVQFQEGGRSFFQKLKSKIASSSKDDDNPFTSVQLHEKLPLT